MAAALAGRKKGGKGRGRAAAPILDQATALLAAAACAPRRSHPLLKMSRRPRCMESMLECEVEPLVEVSLPEWLRGWT